MQRIARKLQNPDPCCCDRSQVKVPVTAHLPLCLEVFTRQPPLTAPPSQMTSSARCCWLRSDGWRQHLWQHAAFTVSFLACAFIGVALTLDKRNCKSRQSLIVSTNCVTAPHQEAQLIQLCGDWLKQ